MYEYNLGIRFQHVVKEQPANTAIWFNQNQTITYFELNQQANRIARWMRKRNITRGRVVCLSGEKSVNTFACIIACLKIGAIYCVLDPDTPIERLRKIFSTCEPRLLIAEREFIGRFGDLISSMGIETLDSNSESMSGCLREFDDSNLELTRSITGTDPAYIMFTSGSTGIPKGALMTHANVLNLIDWGRETFKIKTEDTLTNVNPLYFDNSVFDLYSSLFNGSKLVPFTKDEVKDPKLLVEKVDAGKCTLWFSVPSLLIFLQTMKAADGKRMKSISRFVFGGEGYPKTKLKALYDSYSPSSELFNVYGPTECTCICSSYKLSAADFENLQGLPPLGHIADNFSFLIVDEKGDALPEGETGELCLLGPNVGKGYYNDPERTKASFVQNPLHCAFPDLMYKTGDLARVDPTDGKLYIQGRKDNQIKHMGYRIELEEIEAALNCLNYISEAAVLHGRNGELSRIVAVVATNQNCDDLQIRQDLRSIIPDYMIPSIFHREEILPKNPNGKVDRRYLAQKYLQAEVVKRNVN
ncbi:MAG TPA: amino acid adenylation domain-containing protein [Pyrinomonadaceae bacterium]|nr:amino acid adenylation domain-containing protein [Pyrinomonadaceae bacterium]